MARDDDFNDDNNPGQGLVLRREAQLKSDRQGGALIAALCTLAGVGMGFGVGQLVSAQNNNCAHQVVISRHHQTVQTSTPVTQVRRAQSRLAWLGVRVEDNCDGTPGARIRASIPGSPAEGLGFAAGSTIVNFDGTQITSASGLIHAVQSHRIGQTVSIEWIDATGTHQSQLKLGAITRASLRRLR